jgi:hypothetical protein
LRRYNRSSAGEVNLVGVPLDLTTAPLHGTVNIDVELGRETAGSVGIRWLTSGFDPLLPKVNVGFAAPKANRRVPRRETIESLTLAQLEGSRQLMKMAVQADTPLPPCFPGTNFAC